MSTKQMPRRTFLRGAAGAVLGLPLLEAMAPRSAAAAGVTAAGAPIRMGAVYLPNGVPNLTVVKWHHEQVAYFLKRLDDIEEGDGTLLDHCEILYGSPFADGNEHVSTNLPMLIAGRAGGKIASGRHLLHPGAPAEGVYLSMMDVMGVPVHEIGGVDEAVPVT